jgi:hypothetical protein
MSTTGQTQAAPLQSRRSARGSALRRALESAPWFLALAERMSKAKERQAWAAALTIALCALMLGPSQANAGPSRYVFEMCDSVLPSGGVAGIVAGPHPMLPFGLENTCAQPNGALIIRQGNVGPGGSAGWAVPIKPPPGGRLESITITGAACAVGESSAYVFTPGWPNGSACAEDTRSFPLFEDFGAFFIDLRCIGNCPAGPWVAAHFFATTVVDPVAPTLTTLQGSLTAPGLKRGRQTIGVEAEDMGGGLADIFVSVNGLPAGEQKQLSCNVAQARNPSVIGTVSAQITPCPPRAEAQWKLDTSTYPWRDGTNSVRVCASDFSTLSDPNTSCSVPLGVQVDNSCTESPVAGGEVLSAQFVKSNAEQVTVGYGRSAEVIGRLATDAGDPVPGARLCVKMQTIGVDQKPTAVGAVATDANGRYAYEVPPGPNREVVVGYRHDSAQVAREVRYYARARAQLRVNSPRVENGERVRFFGRLPGPSAGGRVVVLQAGTMGSKRWITFRKATADANGAFKAGYRFSSTTRRTRYQFRAVVPRQAGYPWVEGTSKAVKVLVRP